MSNKDVASLVSDMVNNISGVHDKLAKYEEKEYEDTWKDMERNLPHPLGPRVKPHKLVQLTKSILNKEPHEKIFSQLIESVRENKSFRRSVKRVFDVDNDRLASNKKIKLEVPTPNA